MTGVGTTSTPASVFETAARPVSAEKVLRMQGYADPSAVPTIIRETAEAMAAQVAQVAMPRAFHRAVPIERLEEGTLVADGIALHCDAFGARFARCREVVPFVLTLGEAFDERVIAHAEGGDLLEALLLEGAGWLAMEEATARFVEHLKAGASARGLRVTTRLGPGYTYRSGDRSFAWPLVEQRALFELLAEPALPVTLLEGFAMKPKFSRSGMHGLAPVGQPEAAS